MDGPALLAAHASPAAERNKEPILTELKRVLGRSGRALEIGSGSGQHATFFSAALPDWRWLPTNPDAGLCDVLHAARSGSAVPGIEAPQQLDVHDETWPAGPFDLVLSINMIHIAPWTATPALFAGAARVLGKDGKLITYGPYNRGGAFTSPSNAAFDADLRRRDARWGIRDLELVAGVGSAAGMPLSEMVVMPSNNLLLVFGR